MDPLSDVLSLVKPHSYSFRGFEADGAWSIQFGQGEGIGCYAMVSGACWLLVEGVAAAVRITAGDCFLLPRGRPFRLASDLTLAPVDAVTVFSIPVNGGIASVNGGGDCSGVGGYFTLAGAHSDLLLGVLPPIVHVREQPDQATLRWCMDRMRQELRTQGPGGALVLQDLARLLLVETLRAHLAKGVRGGGWLSALADPQIGAALMAMHDAPAHAWTVQALAKRVGMSRSIFALTFKATVGSSPIDYLVRWRMLLAGERLANSRDSVSAVARSFGYESDSAFGAAFKRVLGCSPRQYTRGEGWTGPQRGSARTHAFDRVAG